MEKNGRIGVLIGVGIALAIGLGYWVSRDGDPHDDGAPRLAAGPRGTARASQGSIGFGPGGGEHEARHAGASGRVVVDAGVLAAVPTVHAAPQGRTRPPLVDLPRGDAEESEHSAGWRLGQNRHHLEIVQPRIAHMQELIRGFEERGETAAAEQQRTILQRFQTRLDELRAEQTVLTTQAQQDGTLGEADDGYAAGADERAREANEVHETPPDSVAEPGANGSSAVPVGAQPAAAPDAPTETPDP